MVAFVVLSSSRLVFVAFVVRFAASNPTASSSMRDVPFRQITSRGNLPAKLEHVLLPGRQGRISSATVALVMLLALTKAEVSRTVAFVVLVALTSSVTTRSVGGGGGGASSE